MVAVRNTFSAGDVIVADDLNENFDDLEAALASLDSSNLADDAGIRATHMADRYAIWHDSFWLVPSFNSGFTILQHEASTSIGPLVFGVAGVAGVADATWATIMSSHVTGDSGQEIYLCEVEIRVARRSANTQFRMQVNGITVGGAGVTFDTDQAYYRARQSTPLDDPIAAVTAGDVITYDLQTPTSGTNTMRGVFIRCTWKARLTN